MKIKDTFFYILLFMALTGCQTEVIENQKDDKKQVKVEVQSMKKVDEALSYSYSGQIEASKNIRLSFQIPGQVNKVYIDEGDHVQSGDVLAELNDSKFKSAYNAALATHLQTEDAYQRLKKVYENGSLPEIDWQDIITKNAQTQAALEVAKQNLKDCQLTAPVSGVIGNRDIEEGMNATPNLPVFNLLKMEHPEIKISVPENEINKLQKGQNATVSIGALGEQSFEAVIEKMGVTANPVSRTYEVRLRLTEQPKNIKAGMLCDVVICPENQTQVFVLPVGAVLKDEDDRSFVYVLNESNNTTIRKYVELDGFTHNQVIIKSGIKTDDLVIVSGQNKLSPNAKVRI